MGRGLGVQHVLVAGHRGYGGLGPHQGPVQQLLRAWAGAQPWWAGGHPGVQENQLPFHVGAKPGHEDLEPGHREEGLIAHHKQSRK